ncbi:MULTISPECIES: TetR/AcrR family transcriptional regulator [Oceanobacillus]|uniref:Biofilm operon icaADBC HTH-type negative transcriptional regulator IcaR n=2 Tax=Oceanobacillus TaxID=182709 RepID=A0A0A1M5J8_9BACI|nr:TetR/AcrR family transcriptional regulator [Oceanobacillus oncorhynchi]MDM8099009.1 TetR/AcrR family transcriptional regulator [Oceanobacillus oncorhynchi]UUI39788.1 TetR/AcrR family transcriptional regulator [Oceanobacillus oncorhynchi]CEI80575.1 Biofilm operon icaADBC HTH-type negative transcriptional regulator IcaR [Oceanobacillus oncorhynchi]
MHTKEKILLEGMELFATLGYNGTSMTKIADRVGLQKSSLYAHYNSKEELFFDVTTKIAADYVDFVKSAFKNEGKTAQEKLYLSFQAHVKDMANHDSSIEFYNRFSSYPPKGLKDKVLEILRDSEEQARASFKEEIKKAQADGAVTEEVSPEEAARAFYGLLDGLSYETNYYEMDVIESHGESMWKVFWRGVQA